MAYCPCCRSHNAEFVDPKVPNGLPSKATICGICQRHQGDSPRKSEQREKDHFEQWQYDTEALEARHAARSGQLKREIAALEATVDKLQDELRRRPYQVVTENLDQEIVDKALEAQRRAYHARDYAFRRLSEVRLLHHDAGEGWCRCKLRVDRCRIAQLVDTYRQLERWEFKQWQRHQQGLDHMLPEGHAAAIDPRWRSPLLEDEDEELF